VLHIAAHGVFEEPHADGTLRTGVVLSNGMLLTAAEIGAMEVVPDLVFLNCCHLGKLDRAPTEYNRLAYSVARELIEMGVRAVVAAGWAVDDDAASLFAATFYRALLADYQSFGDAVWEARKAVWRDHPTSTTWGAYQAYGDPGWQLRKRDDGTGTRFDAKSRWTPVAAEELLVELDKLRIDMSRTDDVLSSSEQKEVDRAAQALLRKVPDADWLARLDVCAALGRLYADLGKDWFATAAGHLQRAIERQDTRASTPIAAIEQLANLEACDGEARNDATLVERGIARLLQLMRAADARPERKTEPTPGTNRERAGLLGSAYKRLAAVHARAAITAVDSSARAAALRAMREALAASERWYFGPVTLDEAAPDPYTGINWLFLASLQPASAQQRAQRLAFAQRCAAEAARRFREAPDFCSANSAADSMLVQQLLQGEFSVGTAAQAAARAERSYRDALLGLPVRPKQIQSTVQQLCLMALFHQALSTGRNDAHARTADSLGQLANALLPGACAPVGAAAEGAAATTAATAAAPSAPAPAAAAPAAAPRRGPIRRSSTPTTPRKRKPKPA
jgi:hypothetical protein